MKRLSSSLVIYAIVSITFCQPEDLTAADRVGQQLQLPASTEDLPLERMNERAPLLSEGGGEVVSATVEPKARAMGRDRFDVLDAYGCPSWALLSWSFAGSGCSDNTTNYFDPTDNLQPTNGYRFCGNHWRERAYSGTYNGWFKYWDFNAIYGTAGQTNLLTYLYWEVWCSTAGTYDCRLGSDDGVMLWINGTLVRNNPACRGGGADQEIFNVSLSTGWNRVLMRVAQGSGDWNGGIRFYQLAGAAYRIPKMEGTNMLQNPGFENGNLDYWTVNWDSGGDQGVRAYSPSWYGGVVPRSGNYFFGSACSGCGSGNPIYFGANQNVPVTPGVDYTFAYWFVGYNQGGSGTPRTWSHIVWYDANWTSLGQVNSDDVRQIFSPYTSNPYYMLNAIHGTAPANALYARVHWRVHGQSGNWNVMAVDDFVFCPSALYSDPHPPNAPTLSATAGTNQVNLSWGSTGQPSDTFASGSNWTISGNAYFNQSYNGETCARVDGPAWQSIYSPVYTGTPQHVKVDWCINTVGTSGAHVLAFDGSGYRWCVRLSGNRLVQQVYAFGSYTDPYVFPTPNPVVANTWYTVELQYYTVDFSGDGVPDIGACRSWVYPRGGTRSGYNSYAFTGLPLNWQYRIYSWNNNDNSYLANFRGIDYANYRAAGDANGTYQPVGGLWDDFNDGDYSGWTANGGSWSVVSGELRQTDTSAGWKHLNYSGLSGLTNFVFECDFLGDTGGYVGFAGRKQNAGDNGYLVWGHDSWNYWGFYDWGGAGDLGSAGDRGWDYGVWHHAKMVCWDNVLEFWIDGVYIGAKYSSTKSSGYVSLCTYGSAVRFDNVEIYPLVSTTSQTDAQCAGTYYYYNKALDCITVQSNAVGMGNASFDDGGYYEYGTADRPIPLPEFQLRYYHSGDSNHQTVQWPDARNGSSLMQYSPTGTDFDLRSYARIPLTGGENYLLSGWLKTRAVGASGSPNWGTLALYNSTYGWSSSSMPRTPALTGFNKWTRVQTVATPPSTRSDTILLLGANWGTGYGQVLYDDVRLDRLVSATVVNQAPTTGGTSGPSCLGPNVTYYDFTSTHTDPNGIRGYSGCSGQGLFYTWFADTNHCNPGLRYNIETNNVDAWTYTDCSGWHWTSIGTGGSSGTYTYNNVTFYLNGIYDEYLSATQVRMHWRLGFNASFTTHSDSFEVGCYDGAFSESNYVYHAVTYDTTLPTVTWGGTAPGFVCGGNAVSVDVADAHCGMSGGGLRYQWDSWPTDSNPGNSLTHVDTTVPATPGAHTLYVRAWDAVGNQRAVSRGTYTVNTPPSNGTVAPSSGSFSYDTGYTFTTTHQDTDGAGDLQDAHLLINTTVNGSNCFYGYYNANSNLLYLRDDANTTWLGGYAPGSANTIQNSYAILDCQNSSTSSGGNVLTVNWRIQFKQAFCGTGKNLYLYTRDDCGSAGAGWEDKGDATVPCPTNTPTRTPTATRTNTPTHTQTFTFTPTHTPTNTPTDTPTLSPTPIHTDTPAAPPIPNLYALTDMGLVGWAGGDHAINNANQVGCTVPGEGGKPKGVIWTDSDLDLQVQPLELQELLPQFLGHDAVYILDINDNGDATGISESLSVSNDDRAFLWNAATQTMTNLGGLSGSWSQGWAINNNQQIAGWSNSVGARWQIGTWKSLSPLTRAHGINDNGWIVGDSGTPRKATRWVPSGGNPYSTSGTATVLGTLGTGRSSRAFSVNARNNIVGYSNTVNYGTDRGFMHDGTTMINLGTLPGGDSTWATAINDFDQIVGWGSTSSGQQVAVVWDENRQIHNLNDHIDSDLYPGWVLTHAYSINNIGRIVGYATYNGQQHYFVLSPPLVDEDQQEFSGGMLRAARVAGNPPKTLGLRSGRYHHRLTSYGANYPVPDSTDPPPGFVRMYQPEPVMVNNTRVTTAVGLLPEGFGFENATLKIEFSSQDIINWGAAASDFRVVRFVPPIVDGIPAGIVLVSNAAPSVTPVRSANGLDFYEIVVPIAQIGSIYGALPQALCTEDWRSY